MDSITSWLLTTAIIATGPLCLRPWSVGVSCALAMMKLRSYSCFNPAGDEMEDDQTGTVYSYNLWCQPTVPASFWSMVWLF